MRGRHRTRSDDDKSESCAEGRGGAAAFESSLCTARCSFVDLVVEKLPADVAVARYSQPSLARTARFLSFSPFFLSFRQPTFAHLARNALGWCDVRIGRKEEERDLRLIVS